MTTMDRVGMKVFQNQEISKLVLHDFDPEENIDSIIQNEVLDWRKIEEVRAEKVPYKRKELFYSFLKQEPQGYNKFMVVLRQRELTWIEKAVYTARKNLEVDGGGPYGLDCFNGATRGQQLNEKQLMLLADYIGIRWESIGIQLGFGDSYRFDIQGQNPTVNMRATKMLIQFKQREPRNANLEFLVPVLEKHGIVLEAEHIRHILKD